MVNANGDAAVDIDVAGDGPAPTSPDGKIPASVGTSTRSKRVIRAGTVKSTDLAGLGVGQGVGHGPGPGNTSVVLDVAKPRSRQGDARSGKTELVLKRLRLSKGATIAMLMEITGWQAHSVRGFLSAVVRKKLGLALISEVGKDGARRYRINDSAWGA
ncbi:DUF3489 domain-containing protein [Mesorhizobium sp. A556]